MANTERLGFNYKGKAWNDGEPVTRVTMPDGSTAEGVAALTYVWDGTAWVKSPGEVKFAPIVASASGVTNLVAAVATKKIRVMSYVLISNGAVNVKFQTHVTPTDLSGLLYLVANTGASASSPYGLFQSVSGEALDLNLSGAVAVGGHLSYIEA